MGHTTWGTILKGYSYRKVENHCPKGLPLYNEHRKKNEQTETSLQSRNVGLPFLLSKYVTKNPGPTTTKPDEKDRSGGNH